MLHLVFERAKLNLTVSTCYYWIPAFAGMTCQIIDNIGKHP